MLTSENLLETLIEQVKVTDIFGSLLFRWNRKLHRFQLKSKAKKFAYKTRLLTSCIYAFFMFMQIFWTWNDINIFVKLHSMFIFCALIIHIYTHKVFYSNSQLVVAYLNGMLNFENRRKNQNWKSNDGSKHTKILMKMMELSCVAVPLSYHVELIRNPCLPPYVGGYWLVDTQCGGQIGTDFEATWSIEEIFKKLIVCFVSYFNWSFLTSGSYFHVTLVLLLKSHCLNNYILLAGQIIQESMSARGKTNWHTSLIYKEVQVMSIAYRHLYSCHMIAGVLMAVIFMHTISLYACFNFGITLPLSMFFLFSLCSINGVGVLVYMCTSLARVFTASTNVHEQLKIGMNNSPWFRRYLKSCKILKVYIGETSFVEPLTPLIIEQFSIEQCISLMLLEN